MPISRKLHWLERFATSLSDKRAFVLSFALGFVIRLIPEVLSFPNAIGFDTVYYAARIKSGVVWSSWTSIFSMWLLEGVLTTVNGIVQMNPFLLLKIAVPLLYGLNVCGIYYFSTRGLNWTMKTALMASFFFSIQLASLRISWDLHRNLLGCAVLLFMLPSISRADSKKSFAVLLTMSLLLVISHTLVSAVLFAVVLGMFIGNWLKRKRLQSLKLFVAVLPAFAVLLLGLLVFPPMPYTLENVIVSEDTVRQNPGGLFFLANYLGVMDTVQKYPTYLDLALHVVSLFSVLYLWWLPLVLVGFFKNRILNCWTLMLLFGSFNALITPFCALDLWNRWMFMLVYPFTFYAINGVEKLYRSGTKNVASGLRLSDRIKVTRKTIVGIFSLTVVFGSIFLTIPPFCDRLGLFSIPTTTSYLPSTMLYNSVPLRDVQPAIEAFEWLNRHMNDSSSVLIHYAFFSWANFYLDKKHTVVYFVKDVEKASGIAQERGFSPVYLVWWNEDYLTWQNQSIGWYGVAVPLKHFKYTFSSDRISVLRYSTD